jgi:GTP-binding protein HflX
LNRVDPDHALDELAGLAEAAGARVVLRVLQDRPKPDPATFLGSGKVETLARACAETGADVVIFDNELSPAQLRNLESKLDRKVVDRKHLILDIFSRRARTREGKLQVELAQLKYLMPRLVGAGTALSRLGGGIGTRGPGETKLETDRRRIRHRIAALTREIAGVGRRRAYLRARRGRSDVPTVALVGYTNAGKSSWMRALTASGVHVEDKLFATLDTTVRALQPETHPRILVSDTVGFIKKLPHDLVASFRSTLDEARECALLVQLVDASDPAFPAQIEVTREVLASIGATESPRLLVLNKADRLDAETRARLARDWPDALLLSVKSAPDVAALRERIVAFFESGHVEAELVVPYARQRVVAEAHAVARVLEERHDATGTTLRVRGTAEAVGRLREMLERS